ncbi:MAG: prepilin-type N-terminal cleavage/methylation domain-containing protein [Ruminococcus sp.]|nr:prepilin-type N-terminal cleavage/methylation domain-containing protein [Ruminococcus sp.]
MKCVINKKGFTLVEMLAVVAILAVVTTFAASSAVSVTRKGKESLYCTKLDIIRNEARSFGLNLEKELNNSNEYYNGYKSLTITVDDLVKNGNLSPDKDDYVLNPVDNSYINDLKIIIYLKNNNIAAYIASDIC